MRSKMPKSTEDYNEQHSLLALFKGESGEGKSVAALSFPEPYVFDFDKKMPGIALKHFKGKVIHYDTFNSIFEAQDIISGLQNYCPYKTIIADSFTALANLTIKSVGEVKGEDVPELLKKVQSTKGGAKQIEMMGIDYYGGEDRFCTWFIDQLKMLHVKHNVNVIVTAHVIEVTSAPDLKTKYISKTRSIVAKGRKVAAWLPTEFDNVYHFAHLQPDLGEIDQSVRRVCITEAFGDDSAKCSLALPSFIDFTNGSLYEGIFPNANK